MSGGDPSGRGGARDVLVRVRGVSKRFGPTRALEDVSVEFAAGEIHALMGENGAGKSTLGKIIAGLFPPDSGEVIVGGRPLRLGSIHDSFAAGVRIVHQELAQCPNLTVAENLCLHDLPRTRLGMVDFAAAAERAEALLQALEPSIDVRAPLGALSPGHRQIVQIASALDEDRGRAGRRGGESRGGSGEEGGHGGARCIVFDEPTSSLAVAEVERLMAIIRRLRDQGLTIIYVSHRMGEIFALCDRVTVLRDGRFIATSRLRDIDESALVEQMVGRPVAGPSHGAPAAEQAGEVAALRALAGNGGTRPAAPGPAVLEVRGLRSPGRIDGASFEVRAGEIVGIGGLVGSGRSELLDAVFGLDTAATGLVRVDGRRVARGRPRASIAAAMGYVPEDRKLQGLFFELGVDENIVAPVMPILATAGVRRPARERSLVSHRLVDFQVKTASPRSLPGELSGGNQQKLLIARWMGEKTRVLLLDEPTRGIDVGTKAEIYRLIREAAARGAAVLMVSSEMPELLALSDRVLVMCGGRITGELTGDAMTQQNILRLAMVEEPSPAG